MNPPESQLLTVSEKLSGVRLGDFLERTWPTLDRVVLRALLRDGSVEVNFEAAVAAELRLRPGDAVRVELPAGALDRPRRRARPTPELAVLVETDWCLVVDKPSGMPSVPDRAGKEAGVHGELANLRPDDDLRIAHRLDRETSGCLVLARGLESARWLDRCFREREVSKEYHALVEGRVARDAIDIRRALGPDSRRPGYVTVVRDGAKKSREAETRLEVLERFRGHTLVRLLPKTGRGHQLRAHLRSIGHPIVADVKYGAAGPLLVSDLKRGYKTRPGVVETPLLDRFFLHAASIRIPAPDGTELVATSPLPPDLQRALAKVRRFAAVGRRAECN